MNEKRIALAILGLVLVLEGFIANEFFLILARESIAYIPGLTPHSGPLIIATAWLSLVPVGFMLVFISICLELIDRHRRTDPTEIWEQ
jgi:uncharacterized membrane protein